MKAQRLILVSAALGMASMATHAQSNEQLQQALSQAQAAAAQAQAAAKQAQAALEQAQAAAESAKASNSAAAPAAKPNTSGALTFNSGPVSATLYGLIDITLFNKNANGHTTTSPDVAWFSGNRWGITGARQLGGDNDLKAIFRLESEFESETGNMDTPGVLFNRDAWLGLESKSLGKLTFGRQNALGRDPAASAIYGDAYGPAKASLEEGGYSNNNNFKQLIFYAGSANGTRVNNGVTWKKAFSNGFVTGLQYSFGGVPDSFNTGTSRTASLAYNGDMFTVAGFATSANVANLTHQSYSVGGSIQINPLVKLNAGYYNYTAQQASAVGDRKDSAWTLSTKLTPGGAFDYELGYQVMTANNAGLNGSGYVLNAFADASGVTAVGSGNRSTVYGSVFYHLDSATEIYAAFDHLNTTDTYLAAQAGGAKSADEVGVGMRFKF
ncbi:porin [Rhodoferax sp. GW822-FHT02A01]|uniref:porin n=1 Tax=Rhodoferax sp. GW822-FHT02A01 TaxID=3141537 RepID=UPI00315D72E8